MTKKIRTPEPTPAPEAEAEAAVAMVNKSHIVAAIAAATGVTKALADEAFRAFVETISEGLISGQEVRVTGIGNFRTRDTAPRKGHNPRTGEACDIPAGRAVKFTAAKSLKEAVLATLD